ncbi:MAG: hypothetical protein Q4G14_04135 [Paracoccus sp. (in: a-proteobacteria)]|uniref:hypothetical protein n=1 Tax=Paracoccus sp. TaxID=267 RepID=UPI0026E0267C|nr:hypothetical protein [Paracoccus sp. (in: a-proteobacteria)]MDO5612418.1 hypothetical protein [Paracoccus sp. (in: a-proteobacteria)]
MIRFALALALTTLPAAAQSVNPCGAWTRAEAIAEPWEQMSASYADGAVRLAQIDSIEPAAASVHLLILSPPYDEAQARQCRVVSLSRAEAGGWPAGFYALDFPARSVTYDPAKGLEVTMPAQTSVPETGSGAPATLSVTINQATGQITARLTRTAGP